MDLTTRCPHCGTTFPASLEQLLLRKGYIRCINCANIFDGYEAVVSGDPAAHATTQPQKPDLPVQGLAPEPPARGASAPIAPPESAAPLPGSAPIFTATQRGAVPSEVASSSPPPATASIPIELQHDAVPQPVAPVPERASGSDLLQGTAGEQGHSEPAAHQIPAQAAPSASTPSHSISESGGAAAVAGAKGGPSFIISGTTSQDGPGSNESGADDSAFSISGIVRRRSEQRESAAEPDIGQRSTASAAFNVTGTEPGARQEPVLGAHTLAPGTTRQPHFVASPKPDTVAPLPVAASAPPARLREPGVDVRRPGDANIGPRHTPQRPEPALPIRSRETLATSPNPNGVYIEPRNVSAESQDFAVDIQERSSMGSLLARAAWRVLVVLGVAVLLAQLVYVYRVQIANQVPVVRPLLETACASLQCAVPYSREISAISIMNSALRAETASASGKTEQSAGSSNIMVLTVTLRNNYAKPQEWPTLVLGLTDFSGTLIVRRNLPPEAYLPANIASQPFPAGSEITARVPIVLNDNKVSGYQLDKFFQ